MFCTHCAKALAPEANFCSNCGSPIRIPYGPSRITRPRQPRMIAGVCSALALHYGWDLTLVRVLTVVITLLTSGAGVLVYIAAWILIPDAQYALPFPVSRPGTPA